MRYLVFGRRAHEQPLEHRGGLDADREPAQAAVLERFGEDWVELVLVPEAAARWAIGAAEREAAHA